MNSIIKETILDNTTDQYIVINPTAPNLAFYPKEESFMLPQFDWDITPPATDTKTSVYVAQTSEWSNHKASGSTIPINSRASATDYIGATIQSLPYYIREQFANFTYYNPKVNGLFTLGGSLDPTIELDLFDSTDTVPKLGLIFNGLQALRIPADRFNVTLTNQEEIIANGNEIVRKDYGKYYIKISPKYIDVEINSITDRQHKPWPDIIGDEYRRKFYGFDSTPFENQPWDFEYKIGTVAPSGRLFGSIVEILDASKTTIKQTKVCMDNIIIPVDGIGSAVLSPDIVGMEAYNQAPAVGDILRFYPRETYFNPILIELEYKNNSSTLEAAIRYLKNDIARDLNTNIIQVYDDNGISVDSQGNVNGVVTEAYQISVSQNGQQELRRQLKID